MERKTFGQERKKSFAFFARAEGPRYRTTMERKTFGKELPDRDGEEDIRVGAAGEPLRRLSLVDQQCCRRTPSALWWWPAWMNGTASHHHLLAFELCGTSEELG